VVRELLEVQLSGSNSTSAITPRLDRRYSLRVIVVETERLSLRRLLEDDAVFLQELMGEESYRRYLFGTPDHSLEEVRVMIREAYIGSYVINGFGLYLVQLTESAEPVGICGLVKRENLTHVDLGYGFLRRFWSQGYAIEAARGVVEHARRDLDLKRIVAATHPENSASIRLLLSLGMRLEGTAEVIPGTPMDNLYGMDL
jgi:[ribosomal protein S5]-alanine N-acetyltransferase